MTNHNIGVDVSKETLDAYRLIDDVSRTFPNDAKGFKALVAWIGPDVERVVFEPTGPYHRALERALADRGLPMVKVNPRQARRFAEATGKLAKTDRLDAAVLARMGALLRLEVRPAPSQDLGELKELHIAREALIKERTASKNRAKGLTLALLKGLNAAHLVQIERQIDAIEAEIEQRIQAQPELARRFEILISIPGLARITAFALLIDMPELGVLEPGQAAALAGLAPIARQSGRWSGRAFIRGGRASVRRALYMPTLVAIRFNPDLKRKYQKLIDAGKPAKVAIVATMRKMILLANVLLKKDKTWDPRTA